MARSAKRRAAKGRVGKPGYRRRVLLLVLAIAFTLFTFTGTPTSGVQARKPLTIFAAASTTDAVSRLLRAFEDQNGIPARAVFAASSTLARQIAQGAPADLFLSANSAWMDDLARRGLVDHSTRIDLLGNTLVLIAPKGSDLSLKIGPGFALARALADRRLAMGDPAHVPAGMYGKAALEHMGIWPQVASRTAYLGDVRSALALVARGEAAAGIVYASDAHISPDVRIMDRFPTNSHPAIVYPLAVVTGQLRPGVMALHRFMRGAEAQEIFASQGFILLGEKG